jgi:exodeoxyribonuclease VII small subunit
MPRPKRNESAAGPETVPETDPETNPETNREDLTFEEAFRRLQETAEALEAGGLPLAQAAAIYEQGMALVQRCNQLLNETELKITQLKESFSGAAAGEELPEAALEWEDEENDA